MRPRPRAFTLVELLVVVLVVAVLAAVAVPRFLSARARAADAAARASLRSIVSVALAERAADPAGRWPDTSRLAAEAGGATFTAGAATAPGTISVAEIDGALVLATASSTGTCQGVRVGADGSVGWSSGTGLCTAIPAPAITTPAGAGANVVFCRTAADCTGLAGTPGDFSYQFAFVAAAGTTYGLGGVAVDVTSTSWSTGTALGGLTFTSPTAGTTVTGSTVTVTASGPTTITVTGVPTDRTVVFTVQALAGGAPATETTATDALAVFTTPGTHTFHAPTATAIGYLVVAGGGGGANDAGGGGGAGGFRTGTVTASAGTTTVTVGAGGTRSTDGSTPATNGGNSAAVGGRGAAEAISTASLNDAASGGSGGGGGALAFGTNKVLPGQPGIDGEGHGGGNGNGLNRGAGGAGGGGGGAGEPGNTDGQGAGGDGAPAALTGRVVHYAGGGAGNTISNSLATGIGGDGGGGSSLNGTTLDGGVERRHGRPNTGGGGAAQSGSWGVPGNGGSGIVVLRRSTSATPGAPGTPTGTVSGSQVTLAWTPATAETAAPVLDYRVEFRTTPTGPWRTAADGVSTTTTATVTGLTLETTHEFRVTALSAAGPGPTSGVLSVAPTGGPAPAMVNPSGATANVVFCRIAADCAGLAGSPGAFTYQFAFTAVAGTTYELSATTVDATSTSWSDGTALAGVTFTTPTAGATVTGATITTANAGTTTVTASGVSADRAVFFGVRGTSGGSPTTARGVTDVLAVYTTTGSHSLRVPAATSADHLVVGGGGAGGRGAVTWAYGGGGGGAGGVARGTTTLSPATLTVTVGAAGAASAFGTISVAGGGAGGTGSDVLSGAAGTAGAGASGGGGGDGGSNCAGGAGTAGQGSAGGAGACSAGGGGAGGGGGGAGGAGAAATGVTGGAGGAGLADTITGRSVTYGRGGTGGSVPTNAAGAAGGANTGSGGGGGSTTYSPGNPAQPGGAGGTGIVVVRIRR
jgi:prepilin-type N-terminal cleavage/methylation domain-containing protein